MPTCPECGQENPEGFKFCSECGASLEMEARPREVRKTVTIVFCDLTGSTALGETLDPERLRALLARYFERMKTIVERHGGTVEKFIGDAVMAVFGVPVVHEDDALRAVRAAAEMRAALPELGVEGRIGVMTGEVVTGTEERLATGDAVNVAARLEQAAQPGEVLIGEPTLELVRDALEVEPVEPLELKGKAEPVPAYRLLRVHDTPERRHEALFVGRERELALVREAWERAQAEQRCELLTLVGDAGVGKSRLIAEALDGLEARVVRARCLPYGEGITYWPVVEVLKQLAVLPPDEAASAAIHSLLGETEATTSAEEIAWAFRKTLEHASAERPLVVVFDDIQSGEETFLDLIEHVALLSSGASILLLAIARPELTERRPTWPLTLRLEPLSEENVEELIPERISGELREKIARAAGGNPLFIEEMLAMAGDVEGEVVVPPTLHALLAARLDQLETAERSVLERGAVEGEIFHRGAVQALAPEETQVTPRLAALVRKELIRPDRPHLAGEDGFRFRHLLIRDAAYGALPKATRAELHERFAVWLEEHGAELVELDEILGYHLEQAYGYRAELGPVGPKEEQLGRKAAARLTAAGQRSLAIGDARGAANLLGRAASLAEPSGRDGVELLLELGAALEDCGDFRGTQARREEAVALAGTLGDRALEIRAIVELADLRTLTDRSFTAEQALELGHEAVRKLEPLGDERALTSAWILVSAGENLRANWQGLASALEHVSEHAHRAGDRRREVMALRALSAAIFWGATPVSSGLPRLEAMLERAGGNKYLEAMLARPIAGFYGMQGHFDEARTLLARARSILEELGRPLDASGLAFFSGPLELLAGDPAAAERELGPGCDALETSGEKGWLSTMAALLAEALYSQDRLDDAEVAVRRSRDAATSDDHDAQALWRRVEAKILARRGKLEEAEGLAHEAVALIDRTDELDLQAQIRMALAEVLGLAQRPADAVSVVEEALRLYEQKGNVVSAKKARALLTELSTAASPGS